MKIDEGGNIWREHAAMSKAEILENILNIAMDNENDVVAFVIPNTPGRFILKYDPTFDPVFKIDTKEESDDGPL